MPTPPATLLFGMLSKGLTPLLSQHMVHKYDSSSGNLLPKHKQAPTRLLFRHRSCWQAVCRRTTTPPPPKKKKRRIHSPNFHSAPACRLKMDGPTPELPSMTHRQAQVCLTLINLHYLLYLTLVNPWFCTQSCQVMFALRGEEWTGKERRGVEKKGEKWTGAVEWNNMKTKSEWALGPRVTHITP